jgi:hypothetical protein
MSKLKLVVAGNKDSNMKELYLEQNGTEVSVSDGDCTIVTFFVNDEGKVVFVRNESIEDEDYLTDENGRIVEVEEY